MPTAAASGAPAWGVLCRVVVRWVRQVQPVVLVLVQVQVQVLVQVLVQVQVQVQVQVLVLVQVQVLHRLARRAAGLLKLGPLWWGTARGAAWAR